MMSKTQPCLEEGAGFAPLFIDGDWVRGGGAPKAVFDPATGNRIGEYAVATSDDVATATVSAAAATARLADLSAYARSQMLRQAAGFFRSNAETIARMITIEQGKPLREARVEVESSAGLFEWFAEEARRAYGRLIPARGPNIRQAVLRKPVGPVAALTPWNFPLSQIARKVAAALAAGCPVVLKPSDETPLAASWIGLALIEAGLPRGAFNIVQGDPAAVSTQLIRSKEIRKVSFTGSVPVGKHLTALAGAEMKRVTMELGGHAPVIITARTDIPRAVSILGAYKFRNAGQVCVSPTRFLVEEAVHDEVRDGLVDLARNLRLGSGLDEQVTMGPLAHGRRLQMMEELVADAVANGGQLCTGGRRHGNSGLFFEPTVIDHANASMRAMNEEPFGPLALISPVKDLEAAITEANRLPYGLAAYAFCAPDEEERVVAEVQSGQIAINHVALGLPETPFGGINESGYGSEGGTEAMDSYLTPQFVTTEFRTAAYGG